MASLPSLLRDPNENTNPHFLQRIVSLSRQNPVYAHEDIFDTRGIKLLPKGERIDENIYERLGRFKLTKPVELSISVENQLQISQLTDLLEALLDTLDGLSKTLARMNADTLVRQLIGRLRLDSTGSLYLALQDHESGSLRHALLVATFAIAMGHKQGMDGEPLDHLATAAVLHDIGEMFVAPDVLRKGTRLSPQEWRHVACHPVIGALAIRNTLKLPETIARTVAEHHERISGYGYPRLLTRKQISPAGALLGAAEQAASIMTLEEGDVPEMLGAALKLIAGEYPAASISLVDQVYHAFLDEIGLARHLLTGPAIGSTVDELTACLMNARAALCPDPHRPGCTPVLAAFIRTRLEMIEHALYSIGINPASPEEWEQFSGEELFECRTALTALQEAINEIPRLITLHEHAPQSQSFIDALADCCAVHTARPGTGS